VVPTSTGAPGHIDGDNTAEVPFDALNPAAQYANATCSNLYCHGNGRSDNGTMSWTADPNLTCNSCHSDGSNADSMSGKHKKHLEEDMGCTDCHADVVNGAMAIIAPSLHIDGARSVLMSTGGTWDPATRRCSNLACHGNERW
jgi:predicted CxxxxCH...CXXCH cytochrome family protein